MRTATLWTLPADSPCWILRHRTGGNFEPVETVEDSPSFLRLDETLVKVTRVGEGLFDGRLGDLMEHHPLHRHLGLQDLGQMPGDGLPFPIFVCGEIQLVYFGQHLFELLDPILSLLGNDVKGLEVVVNVDPEARPVLAFRPSRDVRCGPGEIPYMSH